MRGCALFLVFVLPALLLGAPAPPAKGELPKVVTDYIKVEREAADQSISGAKQRMKGNSSPKTKGYFAEKIRDYERRYYDRVLEILGNMRMYPEHTDLKRKLTHAESRAFDKAIKEFTSARNEAIRRGEASPKRQLEPSVPLEARIEVLKLRDQTDARVRRAKDGLKQPRSAKHKAALEQECRHAERWYYDKALADLQSLLDDPDGALKSKKLDDDDKSAVKDMIQRFERMRDAAVRSGAATDKPQFIPPPKKK